MEEHKVVPDIIPTLPANTAKIQYENAEVNMGNELTPTQVHDKPTVTWPAEDGAYYTLIMTDPDIYHELTRKTKEVQHWIVFNIPGNDIAKGDTAFDYLGSGPPPGTRFHRYVFLIYKQNGRIDKEKFADIKEVNIESRRKFKLADILEKLQLDNLVAGNFYRAQFDVNVPKYYAERLKKFESNL